MAGPVREKGLKQLPDGRWQWGFCDSTGRYRRHVARTKSEARAYLEKARTLVREGRWLNRRKAVSVSFEQAVARFLDHGEATLRPSSLKTDLRLTKRWLASPLFQGRDLPSITQEDLERYRQARVKEPSRQGDREQGRIVSKREVDLDIGRLKRLFTLAVEWGLLERSPAARIRLYRQDTVRTRCLSPEEEERLLAVSPPFLRRLVVFSLHCGARRGEVLGLRWRDIDFGLRQAVIPLERAKGKRERRIYLNAVALSVLHELPRPIDPDALVFGNGAGKPQGNLERYWRKALREAGIEGLRWHDLRHSCATRLLQSGASLTAVREVLGHVDLRTTLRYVHLSQDHLLEAVDLLTRNLQKTCNTQESRPGAAS